MPKEGPPAAEGIPYQAPARPSATDQLAAPVEQRIQAYGEEQPRQMREWLGSPPPEGEAETRAPIDRLAAPVEQAVRITPEPEPSPQTLDELARTRAPQPEGLSDTRIQEPTLRKALALRAQELEPVAEAKKTGEVNPRVDDLLTAIAKLGGWNRDDAAKEGIDLADMKKYPRAFPKEGTARYTSLDDLREGLQEHGFAGDEPNPLLDSINEALRGRTVHGTGYDEAARGPEWMRTLQANAETKLPAPAMRVAIEKALRGDKLGAREARVVQAMLSNDAATLPEYLARVSRDPVAAWNALTDEEKAAVISSDAAMEAGASFEHDLVPLVDANADDILQAKYELDEWAGRRPNGPQGGAADLAITRRAEPVQSVARRESAAREGHRPENAPESAAGKPAEEAAPNETVKALDTERPEILARQLAKRISVVRKLLDCLAT